MNCNLSSNISSSFFLYFELKIKVDVGSDSKVVQKRNIQTIYTSFLLNLSQHAIPIQQAPRQQQTSCLEGNVRECRYEHYLVHPVHTTIITIISSPLVPSYIYIYIQQYCVRVQPQHNEMILSSFPCLYLLSRSPILSITHLFLYFSPPSSYQKRIYALIITYVFIYALIITIIYFLDKLLVSGFFMVQICIPTFCLSGFGCVNTYIQQDIYNYIGSTFTNNII